MNTIRAPLAAIFLKLVLFGRIAQAKNLSHLSSQDAVFVSAEVGESVTLQCFYGASTTTNWYKQSLGKNTTIISSKFALNHNDPFRGEFRNNPRFRLDTEDSKDHLTISNLTTLDSSFYYCLSWLRGKLEVSRVVFLSVKDSVFSFPSLKYQWAFGTDQPVKTLSCTVDTGSCGEEHIVYWVKDFEESQPGLIYTQGGRSDQCMKKKNTHTHTCVYNLPVEKLNLSRAGTYYCAVVACGHILLGEKLKLPLEVAEERIWLVYLLGGALTFTTTLVVFLSVLLYRNRCQPRESKSELVSPSVENREVHQEADNIHYAALSINLPSRTRRVRNTTSTDCVYSRVKI